MKIHLPSLRDGHNLWTESVESHELELDTSSFSDVVFVEFDVEKRAGKIPVSITTRSIGSFYCDRCGEEFRLEVNGKCSIIFIQRENPLPDEMPGDDLRTFLPGQRELDVTTEVRDALLLSVPLRRLCSDNCKGLCPKCGVNLNIETCTCIRNKESKTE